MTAIYRAIIDGTAPKRPTPARRAPSRPKRTETERAVCLAVCQSCDHFDDTGNGAPTCDRLTCCAASKAPSTARFRLALETGKCPIGKWIEPETK